MTLGLSVTLDLRVVSSSPMLGLGLTFKNGGRGGHCRVKRLLNICNFVSPFQVALHKACTSLQFPTVGESAVDTHHHLHSES